MPLSDNNFKMTQPAFPVRREGNNKFFGGAKELILWPKGGGGSVVAEPLPSNFIQ